MRRAVPLATTVVLLLSARLAPAAEPTPEQLIGLPRVSSPAISPDGRRVVYVQRTADWDANTFVSHLWLAEAEPRSVRALTFSKGNHTAPAWSPDGHRVAFLSDRGEKRQVWVLDMRGGDPEKLTGAEEGVSAFAWSPDGAAIAFVAAEGPDSTRKARKEREGDVERGDDHGAAHLWIQPVGAARAKRLTQGTWAVGEFAWSPDGSRIAFDHQVHDALAADSTKDLSVVEVATGKVTPLVTWKGPDSHPVWSPDGTRIAFETTVEHPGWYYANGMIATVSATGGAPAVMTRDFDEDVSLVAWTASGIWCSANQKTAAYLYKIDVEKRLAIRMSPGEGWAGAGFQLTPDGKWVTFVAGDPTHVPEVMVARPGEPGTPLTSIGSELSGWTLGTSEVVQWTSRDGTGIEGVLRKPAGWKPGIRRPLLVVIHGGPTAVSRPTRLGTSYVYPIEHWLAKGALVLEPNYRGSAGYGAAFRALNVRNLGVGDAWDVVSGIEALAARGMVDTARVGVMGWSQGGYISAFLATNESQRFRAISVGAGISDWMTYYVNTDITPFTRQYLRATPWDDPAIYALTSPITNVRNARAPVLIQHGGADARVPTPNARELYRALLDVGVEARLTVYPGFGHGLNKPKAVRSALEENREWFDARLWPTPAARSQGRPGRR